MSQKMVDHFGKSIKVGYVVKLLGVYESANFIIKRQTKKGNLLIKRIGKNRYTNIVKPSQVVKLNIEDII